MFEIVYGAIIVHEQIKLGNIANYLGIKYSWTLLLWSSKVSGHWSDSTFVNIIYDIMNS